MKKLLLLSLILAGGCAETEPNPKRARELREVLKDDLQFMQHPNGFCLAYTWVSDNNANAAVGGPIVFVVPCESIGERVHP